MSTRSDESKRVETLVRALGSPDARVWRSPGRVNIIGEHVDYAGGLVLPFACDLDVLLAAVPGGDAVQLESLEEPGRAVVSLDGEGGQSGWARYVSGVVRALTEADLPLRPIRGVLSSTVPAGAGLSSSAALEVAVSLAVTGGRRPDAPVLQRAEHLAVGVPCGLMDQVAVLHGRAGHAVLLDCADLSRRDVALPSTVQFLVVDTGTRRALADGRYASRRAQVEAAVRAARDRLGAGPRELGLADVDRIGLGQVERRRLRHVVGEIGRVQAAVRALAAGDVEWLGRLIDESHNSLRDDFEVSSEALDLAVDSLRPAPQCLGARLVGAGFAGCVLAAVRAGGVDEVAARVPSGMRAFTVHAVDGAGEIVR